MYIDQLPNLPSADGTERIPVSKNGADYAATAAQLFAPTKEITGTLMSFIRDTANGVGVHIMGIQTASDNPTGTSAVAIAIVYKPLANGDYAIAFVFGGTTGKAYVSKQVVPETTSLTWTQL